MYWLLIIPIVSLIILYKLFPHELTWWEILIPVGSTLFLILIINGITDYALSRDTEYHGGWVNSVIWDEEWTETYIDTETYTDSNGKNQTRTVTKTRYHPDEYTVIDSNDYKVSVDKNHYKMLVSKFGNEKTEHPWRSGQSSWGDGRRFTSVWPGTDLTFTPCFTTHNYENRVARSYSIFNFRDIDPKVNRLYEYPDIENYHFQKSILGYDDAISEKVLTKANCLLGRVKQVRIFILVFRNKSIDTAIAQQMYWKNGNKNEVVVCIGINSDNNINWIFPFCWDNERLKIDIREDVAGFESDILDMKKVVNTVVDIVQKEFSRKHFKDFDYIKLEVPLWIKLVCFLVVVIINIGVGFIVINNEQR